MTAQDAENEFDDLRFKGVDRRRKSKSRKKDNPARESRKRRDEKRYGDHPPREDARLLARDGGESMFRKKEARRRNRASRELDKMRAPSKAIRYPDCPVSGKRSYGSPSAAADAMETIRKVKDGTYFPTRAYRCPDCDFWHMTSKEFQPSGDSNVVSVTSYRKPDDLHDPAELMTPRVDPGAVAS